MLHQLTFFGQSSSGLGALGLDPKAFLIQLVTFVIVFLVLKRYAFKPILDVLEQRRQTIERGVKLGEQMAKEKSELDQKVSQALADARLKADAVIAEAQSAARSVALEAEESARAKADNIVAQAGQQIKQDSLRVRRQLEKELVELVSEATEAIIEQKVDQTKDSQLINKFLKEQARA
ncbi:MAG TPA: F0F1 ATP synthase subunit B [Candidatus Dormibacteraeota bacterium]|nr:F0F1 ATP synthase subunit B [Candidatus Dormibacteraeota bacterium]